MFGPRGRQPAERPDSTFLLTGRALEETVTFRDTRSTVGKSVCACKSEEGGVCACGIVTHTDVSRCPRVDDR